MTKTDIPYETVLESTMLVCFNRATETIEFRLRDRKGKKSLTEYSIPFSVPKDGAIKIDTTRRADLARESRQYNHDDYFMRMLWHVWEDLYHVSLDPNPNEINLAWRVINTRQPSTVGR